MYNLQVWDVGRILRVHPGGPRVGDACAKELTLHYLTAIFQQSRQTSRRS
jgi:hypothetical protein